MRNFKLLNPRTQKIVSVDTDVETWGEFKSLLMNDYNIDLTGLRGSIRSTRTQIELDDALLPENDDMILFTATKMKAGNDINILKLRSEIYDKIDSISTEIKEYLDEKLVELNNEIDEVVTDSIEESEDSDEALLRREQRELNNSGI